MASQLVLYKQEVNPDPNFLDSSKWTLGSGWTFGANNTNGLGAERLLGGTVASLTLIDSGLKPYKTYKWTISTAFCLNAIIADYCKLYIGGSSVVTIATGGGAAVNTGTITLTTNTSVAITTSAGNSVLVAYLNLVEVPDSIEIDLTDEISVPLTLAIADIKDPSKRKSDFSRTVTIPGTKSNNRFFNHIYEISGSGTYNPNKRVKAVLYTDGLLQFSGFCRLNRINRINNGIDNYSAVSYEITLLGNLAELYYSLGDTLISDLDWSEYNHPYTRTNQRNSWYTAIVKDGASYSHTNDGSYMTVIAEGNYGGRLRLYFAANHGLTEGDWILIPESSIVGVPIGSQNPKNYYIGEHMVQQVLTATSLVVQCPYEPSAAGFTTEASGTNRVRQHSKKGLGYVYPMIDYDQNDTFNFDTTQLYPAIFVYEAIQKMAAKAKTVIDSSIIDSVMFKKLILPCNSGQLKLTNEEIALRLFYASSSTDQFSTFTMAANVGAYFAHSASSTPAIIDVAIDTDTPLPMYDNNGVFNTGTYRFTCPNTGIYTLDIGGIVKWNFVSGGGAINVSAIVSGSLQFEVYNYTAAVTIASVNHSPTLLVDDTDPAGTVGLSSGLGFDNLNLISGNVYGVRVRVITLPVLVFNVTSVITVNYGIFANATFGNRIKNTNLYIGDTVNMNSILPKMKCTDLLSNIIKMFNIYLDKDKTNDKKIHAETRDTFYAQGVEVDWTQKLDTSQNIEIAPMGDTNAKYYAFSYTGDKDFYNDDHVKNYGNIYGNKKFQVDNDFATETNETKITFSPTVMTDSGGRVLSCIQGATDTNATTQPQTGNQRILYFNYSGSANFLWFHNDGGGLYSGTLAGGYPYAGHLDKADAPSYDLNFGYPQGVYFAYDAWTDKNLYNLYHKRMVEEIIDRDSCIVTCYMHLTAYDIFTLDFRDRFLVDGHLLRLLKVSDFEVGKNLPVKCEFLKVKDKPSFASTQGGVGVGTGSGNGYGEAGAAYNVQNLPAYANQNNNTNGSGYQIQGQSNVIGNGSFNLTVNGNENTLGANLTNVIVSGNNNIVASGLSNVSIINTSNISITESNVSYVNGMKIENNGTFNLINGYIYSNEVSNVTSSAPINVDGSISVYVFDETGGNVTFNLGNPATLKNCSITFINGTGTGNHAVLNSFNGENLNGAAMPQNFLPVQWDKMTITSDGTDYIIKYG